MKHEEYRFLSVRSRECFGNCHVHTNKSEKCSLLRHIKVEALSRRHAYLNTLIFVFIFVAKSIYKKRGESRETYYTNTSLISVMNCFQYPSKGGVMLLL